MAPILAPHFSGFTRASSLGPIADFMDRQGGSVLRVLREVGLPFALLEQPEIVIPLRAQFRFLEHAARGTGDAYFGARLGQVVRIKELSSFGAWVSTAETLLQAIERANAGLNIMLQTSTVLRLEQHHPWARWSIEFTEPETDGRHHNELLGISYLIDTVRTYAGRLWRPDLVMTALPAGTPRAELEDIFDTNVSNGHAVTSIDFDTALLSCGRWGGPSETKEARPRAEPKVPGQEDALATVASVTDLALYDGYPRIDWVAAKLGVTRRSLQRLLRAHDTTFNRLVGETLLRHAKALLNDGAPITEIALELGYRDSAHFTRAFRRWMGVSPSLYRNATL